MHNACDAHNNIYFCSHYKYTMTSRTPNEVASYVMNAIYITTWNQVMKKPLKSWLSIDRFQFVQAVVRFLKLQLH